MSDQLPQNPQPDVYTDRIKDVWKSLRKNNDKFKTPFPDFFNDFQNPEIRSQIHGYLTNNIDGFKVSPDQFELDMGFAEKKKTTPGQQEIPSTSSDGGSEIASGEVGGQESQESESTLPDIPYSDSELDRMFTVLDEEISTAEKDVFDLPETDFVEQAEKAMGQEEIALMREMEQIAAEDIQNRKAERKLKRLAYRYQTPEVAMAMAAYQEFVRPVSKQLDTFVRDRLPAAYAGMLTNLAGLVKDEDSPFPSRRPSEELQKATAELVEDGLRNLQESAERLNDPSLVQTYKEIDWKSPLDVLNYIAGTAGEAAPTTALAIVTPFGSGAIALEMGNAYLEGVADIADKKGISPEEVIEQGLDEPVWTAVFGTGAGLMEKLGANKIAGAIKGNKAVRSGLMTDIRNRARNMLNVSKTEALTEAGQQTLTSYGSARTAGADHEEALQNIKAEEIFESALKGGIGGPTSAASFSGVNALLNPIAERAQKRIQERLSKKAEEPVTEEPVTPATSETPEGGALDQISEIQEKPKAPTFTEEEFKESFKPVPEEEAQSLIEKGKQPTHIRDVVAHIEDGGRVITTTEEQNEDPVEVTSWSEKVESLIQGNLDNTVLIPVDKTETTFQEDLDEVVKEGTKVIEENTDEEIEEAVEKVEDKIWENEDGTKLVSVKKTDNDIYSIIEIESDPEFPHLEPERKETPVPVSADKKEMAETAAKMFDEAVKKQSEKIEPEQKEEPKEQPPKKAEQEEIEEAVTQEEITPLADGIVTDGEQGKINLNEIGNINKALKDGGEVVIQDLPDEPNEIGPEGSRIYEVPIKVTKADGSDIFVSLRYKAKYQGKKAIDFLKTFKKDVKTEPKEEQKPQPVTEAKVSIKVNDAGDGGTLTRGQASTSVTIEQIKEIQRLSQEDKAQARAYIDEIFKQSAKPTAKEAADDVKKQGKKNDILKSLPTIQSGENAPVREDPHKNLTAPAKRAWGRYHDFIKEELGFEQDTDRKGKPEKASINFAPIGGDASFILWKPNSDYGVYVNAKYDIEEDPDDATEAQDRAVFREILWRVTTKAAKYTGLHNNFKNTIPDPEDFAQEINKAIESYEKSKELVNKPIEEKIKEKREQVKKELDDEQTKLRDLLEQFGKNEGLMTGVDPKQIELAGQIIAQAGKVGIKKFEDIVLFALENLPLDVVASMFDSLKRAYFAAAAVDNPNNEDFNALSKLKFEELKEKADGTDTGSTVQGKAGPDVGEDAEGGTPTGTPTSEGQEATGPTPDQSGEQGVQETDRTDEGGDGLSPGDGTDLGGSGGDVSIATGEGGNNSDVNRGLGGKSGPMDKKKPGQGVVKKKNNNNFVIPEDFYHQDSFSPTKAWDDNNAALELLVQLRNENWRRPGNTQLSVEEQQTLFKFVGWGGIRELDKSPKNEWGWSSQENRRRAIRTRELMQQLDPEGEQNLLRDAIASTQTAFYTPVPVIRSIYKGLDRLGFKGGKILEPSAGTGHFIGAMPQNVKEKAAITGVELDYVTAHIMKLLYPDAVSYNSGIQEAPIGKNFDLVISNVPFGDFKVADKDFIKSGDHRERSASRKIHNYFFAKAIRHTRPGGLIAFVTATGTMDSPSSGPTRQLINEETQFLGAIRLPNTTFKGNAGTEVTSDVIFLRKLEEGETVENPDILSIEQVPTDNEYDESTIPLNKYFRNNPDMVLGEFDQQWFNQRYVLSVEPKPESDLITDFEQALESLPENVYKKATSQGASQEAIVKSFTGDATLVRSGSLVMDDEGNVGVAQVFEGKFGKEVRIESLPKSVKTDKEKIKRYIQLRDVRQKIINEEINGASDEVLTPLRKQLDEQYTSWVSNYGKLNSVSNAKLIDEDIDGYNVFALERYDPKTGKFTGKADIFTKRTVKQTSQVENEDDPQKAVLIAIAETGGVDPERVSNLTGRDWEELMEDDLKGLVFEVPEGGYEYRDYYLSGDVKEKLKVAQVAANANDRFKVNVEELEKVIPEDAPPELIGADFGANYIPKQQLERFLKSIMGGRWNIAILPGSGEARIKPEFKTSAMTNEWGVESLGKNIDGDRIAQYAYQNTYPKITYKNAAGESLTDEKATKEARRMIVKMRKEWDDWWINDEEARTAIARSFNDQLNTSVKTEYDGSFLDFPGLSKNLGGKPFQLMRHQVNAIAMLIQRAGGVIDHVVGAGKTLVMIVGAMEMKRLGIAKKPMILGLKANLPQMVATARQVYPGAKILAPTAKDFTAKNRNKVLSQISNNDWDLIFLTHDNFGGIPHSYESTKRVIDEELTALEMDLFALEGETDQVSKQAKRGMEKRKANLEERLINKAESIKKDAGQMYFDQLGVDHIMVDESHHFKRLGFSTKYRNIAGLSPSESNRASHLFTAVRHLQRLHGADKGTTFASGTPLTNSIAEIYLLLKYLRPSVLSKHSFHTFDSWARTFAIKETEMEFNVAGQLKQKDRFRDFQNIPELSLMYREIADVQDDRTLDIPKPKVKGGKMQMEELEPTELQKKYFRALTKLAGMSKGTDRERFASILGINLNDDPEKKGQGDPLMLLITNSAKKAAIDMRLINPKLPDESGSKINSVVADVWTTYNETHDRKGTQLIFLERGVPGGKGINLYEDIKSKLVKRGIPESEIAFIHDIGNSEEKKALFMARLNAGDIRVAIGGTKNLGTGLNIQERGSKIHHIDPPWTPAELDQRNGRFIRQGNIYEDEGVSLKTYGVVNSLDAMQWGLIDIKANYIHNFKSGNIGRGVFSEPETDDAASMSYTEFVAAMLGNPALLEKANIDRQILDLEGERVQHQSKLRKAQSQRDLAEKAIENEQRTLDKLRKDWEYYSERIKRDDADKVVFEITLGTKVYSDSNSAGKAMENIHARLRRELALNESQEIGEIYGSPIIATKEHDSALGGGIKYVVKSPNGISHSFRGKVAQIGLSDVTGNNGRMALESVLHIEKLIETYEGHVQKSQDVINNTAKILDQKWDKQSDLDAKKQRQAELEEIMDELARSGKSLTGEQDESEVFDFGLGVEEVETFEVTDEEDMEDTPQYNEMAFGDKSSRGRKFIGKFQTRLKAGESTAPFKLYDAVLSLVKKWAPNSTLGQDGVPRGALGVYYNDSKAIRLKGLTDFAVAIHELTHALDKEHGIIQKVIDNTTRGDAVRKMMTQLYVDKYPGGKKEHSLYKRMTEAYATLLQVMAEDPALINQDYKLLYNKFLDPKGEFYWEGLTEFMEDFEKFIYAFHNMDNLDKMGAYITNNPVGESPPKFSATSKAIDEFVDTYNTLEELAKKNGTHFTADDLSLDMRKFSLAMNLANRNITGGADYVLFRKMLEGAARRTKSERLKKKIKPASKGYYTFTESGETVKTLPYNWHDLQIKMKDMDASSDFDNYLFARTVAGEYEEMQQDIESLNDILFADEESAQVKGVGGMDAWLALNKDNIERLEFNIDRLKTIYRNRGVEYIYAKQARDENAERFKELEDMYDRLTRQDLKLLRIARLINDEQFTRYALRDYYAPEKKAFFDDLLGQESSRSVKPISSSGKVASTLRKKGSTKPTISPVYSAMMNHAEIMTKAMRQMAYNKVLTWAPKHTDLFNIEPAKPIPGGRLEQEGSREYIIARDENGKKVPIRTDQYIKDIIDNTFNPRQMNFIEVLMEQFSRLFRSGTTGWFIPFSFINWTRDQFTAYMFSQTGYVPFITGPKETFRALLNPNSEERRWMNEYIMMAGGQQTFTMGQKVTYEDVQRQLSGKVSPWAVVSESLDAFVDFMSFPGYALEMMTRVAEYIRVRRRGGLQKEALEKAGRVSGPFHHMGKWTPPAQVRGKKGTRDMKSYVRSMPYTNAIIQVLHQQARTINTPKGRLRTAVALGSFISAQVISTAAMFLAADDDDEQKRTLLSLPPELLSRYLYIYNPYGDTLLQIAIPETLGFLVGAINMMTIDLINDHKEYGAREYAREAFSVLPNQVNPTNTPFEWLMAVTPQLGRPGIEAFSGMKTFPQERPLESLSDKKLEPRYRYTPYTSPLAIKLGDELNMSPKVIDHLIEGYLGRGTKYLTLKKNFLDLPMDVGTVIYRELYFSSSRQVQYFWDKKQEIDQKINSIKAFEKRGEDIPYSEEYYSKLLDMRDQINVIKEELDIYKTMDPEQEPKASQGQRTIIFELIKELKDIEQGK
jgi:N12 class adenine-specific DNA methylase